MRLWKITLLLLYLLLALSAWGRVFVRWSLADVPSAESLGVRELVVPSDARSAALMESARNHGYHVYTNVSLKQASEAAESVTKNGLSGIILDPGEADPAQVDESLRALRSRYPKIVFLLLDTNGKQPDMRGQTVTKREGILEVSSPTAQPWIDSNLALVRFDQTFRPGQLPVYSFHWDLSDPLQREQGPSAEDYSLAVAEQGAFHADLVLDLHEKLQKDLLRNDQHAWATWNRVKKYISFYSHTGDQPRPRANVAAVMSDMETYYEAINLMARHNIPFRVLRPEDLTARNLNGLEMLVVFAPMNVEAGKTIAEFAASGRNVVLVNLRGAYPWHSATPIRTGKRSVAYEFGKGRIVEFSGPITEPEIFAQDVRRLMDRNKMLITLWNVLATLAVPYRRAESRETIVELVNYAQEPLDVQVQVAGSFSSAQYDSPERGCCQSLKTTQGGGFTEFVVPELKIAGRIHLRPTAPRSDTTPQR